MFAPEGIIAGMILVFVIGILIALVLLRWIFKVNESIRLLQEISEKLDRIAENKEA